MEINILSDTEQQQKSEERETKAVDAIESTIDIDPLEIKTD